MAKKKTTNPTNLMAYDFLPNMGANAGGGMYSQLAQLGRVQRSQPVMNQMATQALFSPITTYINKAEEQAVAGMVEYNMANPDVDDSQLFDGTEEAIGAELQNNSTRFRELNRKLAYMSPNNKDYADTVTEINKINKANVELRDQNKKLLDIRNLIKSSDVSELAGYNGAAGIAMYTDIQQGNKENFSIKNGKITWNNPNEGPVKSIDVDTIPTEGPAFKNKAGYNYHTQNKLKTFKLNEKGAMTPDALNSLAYTMREELGEGGIKSLIWDNQNGVGTKDENGNVIPPSALSKNGRFYNTEPFIQQYIASAGKSISDPFIIEELKTKNTNYVLPGANKSIGDAFMDFYKGKLSKEKTFGGGYVPPKSTGEDGGDSFASKFGGYGSYRVKTNPPKGFGEPKSITFGTAIIRRNALNNFEPIGGEHESYNWSADKKKWIDGSGDEYTSYEVATIEGLIKINEGRADFEGDVETASKDKKLKAEGLAPSTALKMDGDDAASGELNRIFGMQMGDSDYYFHPFSKDVYRGTFEPGSSDNAFTNDVMLYDKATKRPVIDEATGKPYRFKTGSDYKEDQLKILNDLMKQLGYVKKVSDTNILP